MKRINRYVISALSVLALGTTFNVNSANASSKKSTTKVAAKKTAPSLTVPNLEAGQKNISGTATKGVTVTVKADDKNQTKIADTVASTKDGKYTIKLPKAYNANTKLYVYAQAKGARNYFYRIINIKPKGFFESKTSTTNKKANKTSKNNAKKENKKTTSKNNNKVTISDPSGTWNSKAIKGVYNQITFSQKNGFSQTQFNGKKSKAIVKNASYQIIRKNASFWEVQYHQPGVKKNQTVYFHFNSNTQFYLTNSKDQVSKSSNDFIYNLAK